MKERMLESEKANADTRVSTEGLDGEINLYYYWSYIIKCHQKRVMEILNSRKAYFLFIHATKDPEMRSGSADPFQRTLETPY